MNARARALQHDILGIDVGSTSLAAVLLRPDGTIAFRHYAPHGGDIPRALAELDRVLADQGPAGDRDEDEAPGPPRALGCAVTGPLARGIRHDLSVDSRVACIRSIRERYPRARAVLLVGGEHFSLIRFDRDGTYRSVKTNTSCAAGTGGFLDQQAGRLSMADSAELSATALANTDPVPLVATRCAVFAKTDLIHAQQEGYSLSAISTGLCRGVARNLADTLFKGEEIEGPLLMTGGVSRNAAVVREIADLLPVELIVDEEGPCQGAIGAALCLQAKVLEAEILEEAPVAEDHPARHDAARLTPVYRVAELHGKSKPNREDLFPPLELTLSDYPDFSSWQSWEEEGVEVDLYRPWPEAQDAYLGIDIGSTSTKAALTTLEGEMLGGFYTRTAGRPLQAVQALFKAIEGAARRVGTELAIHGSATTGSGRKFVGGIVNADEVLDEISAHARAAVELDPRVDTIIEIGGQDSKFTTLRRGRVTSSVMNTVCAAGTGSFIEEQARRLSVPIREYADLAEGVRAPRVNDRCTVFMDRDINHLLATGYTVPEVLASALHAVRENYLNRVATEKRIGEVIFFQGATARNRSLVAAFEQKLGRPILVSPFCHLTGALGAALTLVDRRVLSERFAGLELWRREIPIRREVCELCTNHCKLTVADLEGRSVAFGFLCGRDYDTEQFVSRNRSGFDLLRERRALTRRLLAEAPGPTGESEAAAGDAAAGGPVIGLPDSLYLAQDLPFWQVFFRQLGIRTRTSTALRDPIRRGRFLTGAEFCAPLTALHGHAAALLEEADYLFLPLYLEQKPERSGALRKYCYYTQFAPAMIAQGVEDGDGDGDAEGRIISPLVGSRYSRFHLVGELHRALSVLGDRSPRFHQIAFALDAAQHLRETREAELRELFLRNRTAPSGGDGLDVVLLGRPYTVLSPVMNKGIPDIFGTLGVRVFYQDMLPRMEGDTAAIEPLLREINWDFGAAILEAAEVTARTPGLYPVILTSFKCGPDSFITEYARNILDAHDKPYLLLELDEHDSSVGYETRIEAALRAFRTHREEEAGREASREARRKAARPVLYDGVNPRYLRVLDRERTLVIPRWDDHSIPLIAAILQGQGYRTIVMEETDATIRRGLRWNNGQCIPMNAVAEGFVETVRNHGLDPREATLWIPSAEFSCNIKLFPHHIQETLHQYGQGFEEARVYLGQLTHIDISPIVTAQAYLAHMFAGLIRRIACRIRPYELNRGETDRTVEESLEILQAVFRGERSNRSAAVAEIMDRFEAIPYDREARRPRVALFGDIYVRENSVFNQDVIHYIEENGGEVVTMPFHEFARMTISVYFRRWMWEGKLGRLLALKPMMAGFARMERWYYGHFERVLGEPAVEFRDDPAEILARFGVRLDHEGESQDNLLKTWYISRQYPDLALFVQLNPGFCCAGLVTEAMSSRI
ncbi:MAG: CoA activase, partial [Spirochaetaceae bacterium]